MFLKFILFILSATVITLDATILEVDEHGSKKYSSVTDAINKAVYGDTVLVYPGRYVISSYDGQSFITLPSGVSLRGTNRHTCILKVEKTTVNAAQLINIIESDNVKIEELTLSSPSGALYIKSAENITVKNCILTEWRVSKKNERSILVADKKWPVKASENLHFEHILFENCNPVFLGEGSSGRFLDNCMVGIKNTNLWHFPKNGWEYGDLYVHETDLLPPNMKILKGYDLSNFDLEWIYRSDGFHWGVIKNNWYPKKKKEMKAKKEEFDDFFNSGFEGEIEEEEEAVEIPEPTGDDVKAPEIYISSGSKHKVGALHSAFSTHKVRGKIFDDSKITKLTVNGEATSIRFDGVFESKVKLTGVTTDIRVEAEDEHGHKANYNYMVVQEQSSGKDTIKPEIHIGKRRKRAMKIRESEPIPQIIYGYAVDASGVKTVTVDGEVAELDKHGNFSVCIFLAQNKKKILITAEDKFGNVAKMKHTVQEGTAIQKSDTRGPEIDVVESDSTTILEGKATNPSDIALLCVDGIPVKPDIDGKFSHDLSLKKGENLLRVAAYDDAGNKTVKLVTRTGLEAANEITPKGKYYALLVGNNDYIYLNKLKTAVNDAKEVGKILKNDFNFKTIELTDATRSDILRKLNGYRKTLKKDDKLIIYYAGHGFYDKKTDAAYWLPVDAEKEDSTNWILSSSITKSIKGIDAKSILVVSDSCYSGTLSGRTYRDASVSLDREDNRKIFLKKMMSSHCRMLMASGGNEPVVDSGGATGHSIFASAFMESLQNVNENIFTVQEIFNPIVNRVGGASDQVPVLDIIRNSGHDSGVFVFYRNRSSMPE